MSTGAEQTFAADGVSHAVVEVEHRDATIRWHEGREIRLRGDAIEIAEHGDGVVVRAPGRRGRVEVDLPAHLRDCTIDIHHGDLELDGPRGTLDARVKHGDVRLRRGQGPARLRVGHGDVTVDGLAGPLTLHTGAGDLTLRDVLGPLQAHSGRGDLSVLGGSGPTTLNSGMGDVTVLDRDCGPLTLHSGRGDITVTGGMVSQMTAQTGAGDLTCSARLGLGRHAFMTGVGDLTVAVPRDLPARIEASTGMGDIRSEPPLVSVGQRGPKGHASRRLVGSIGEVIATATIGGFLSHHLVGNVGEGGERAEISLRTGRGDIRLTWHTDTWRATAAGATSATPEPATATASAEPDKGSEPASMSAPADRHDAPPPPVITLGPAGPTAGPPEPPVPPAPPAPSAPADRLAEQRAILAALAAGTIDVAEAEQLLTALDAQR